MKVPMTATAWDLYSRMAGAEEAAKALGTALQAKLTEAIAANRRDIVTAVRIRDEMYVLMNKFSHLGARDTEPEELLVIIIERELGLPNYDLNR